MLIKIKEQKLKLTQCKPFKGALKFFSSAWNWNEIMKQHFEAYSEQITELNVLEKAENFCTDGLPWNLANSPNTQELWERLFCQRANIVPFKFGWPKPKSEGVILWNCFSLMKIINNKNIILYSYDKKLFVIQIAGLKT